ncbi:hypothetical protein LCGC14_1544510 [marine sediment metagenome]|uniref:Uncharacterized protein n=1 Tax=marine sediment metagenome TaxID=412755 RepID=A0A0F9IS34_9ZZZZ
MKKESIHTLNQIIVLINGKIPHNELLRKNLDNLVILWNNKFFSYQINKFLDKLRKEYFVLESEYESEYIERVSANLPNLITEKHILNKKIKQPKQKKKINLNELQVDTKPTKNRIDNIEKLRNILSNKEKIIPLKSELTYDDIKPYLTNRQIGLINSNTTKNGIDYETKLLTTNQEYFNDMLNNVKKDYKKKYLGNKHIKSKIGIIYRIFTEKT